tara:strand:- start:75 stop:245 length:171 start_codon:yes stop_codon:yes gene_type:complete
MPLTEKQKKLPAGLQKAILAKDKKAPAKKAPAKKPSMKPPAMKMSPAMRKSPKMLY